MKILTGFAVIKDNVGNKLTFTVTEVDEQGTVVSSNEKTSFIVTEKETNDLIAALEDKIKERIK